MVEVGSVFPDTPVFTAPGQSESLRGLAAGSRALYVFYLFDFSGT